MARCSPQREAPGWLRSSSARRCSARSPASSLSTGSTGLNGTFQIVNNACGLALTVADGTASPLPVYGRSISGSPQQCRRVEQTAHQGEFTLVSEASGYEQYEVDAEAPGTGEAREILADLAESSDAGRCAAGLGHW